MNSNIDREIASVRVNHDRTMREIRIQSGVLTVVSVIVAIGCFIAAGYMDLTGRITLALALTSLAVIAISGVVKRARAASQLSALTRQMLAGLEQEKANVTAGASAPDSAASDHRKD